MYVFRFQSTHPKSTENFSVPGLFRCHNSCDTESTVYSLLPLLYSMPEKPKCPDSPTDEIAYVQATQQHTKTDGLLLIILDAAPFLSVRCC